MNNLDTLMDNYERHRQARKELNKANNTAIFDGLAVAKISRVSVEFDGEGDQGQINNLTATRDDAPVALPATTVTLQQASWDNTEPVIADVALQGAIETLCYDFLEEEHGGWENNDGAFGEFLFDVATRAVTLEFNGRFTDFVASNHTF